MHAEEKKALKENTLAHQVTRAYEGIRHGPSRGTVLLIAGAVAVVLIGLLFRYFYRASEAATSERWVQLDEVIFPEQLEELIKDPEFKNTPQGRLLRFKEARRLLTQGLRDLAGSPSLGKKSVEEGTEIYEDLASSAGRGPLLLHQEALWGSAKGNETLGDVAKARSFYERLVKEYPTSAMGKDAANQLARLDSPEGKKEVKELSKILAPSGK